ncbi:MAG: hypothetical protein IJ072_05955 [Oscillospiraceae bacterium]|nr:hypothetical protein [Oscillospiraceae bacterium]
MTYEMVREIYNMCANNQMRDIFFQEVDVEDTDEYIKRFCDGANVTCEKEILSDGTIVYHLDNDGLISCITFTES